MTNYTQVMASFPQLSRSHNDIRVIPAKQGRAYTQAQAPSVNLWKMLVVVGTTSKNSWVNIVNFTPAASPRLRAP